MPEPITYLLLAALLAALGYLAFRPERGAWAQWQRGREDSHRVRTEDVLKHVHKCEMKGLSPTVESVAGVLHLKLDAASQLVGQMQVSGLMEIQQGRISLTTQGRESALHIIRAHRLWERYLADETGYAESDWHSQAEQYEHLLTAEELDALAAQLGNPTHDPHGDPIPTAQGVYVGHGGQPLASLPEDVPAQIVHIEDEPDLIYAQIVAEGLFPGMVLRVIESTPSRVRFWADGDEHLLAPIVANNISVVALKAEAVPEATTSETLSALRLGEQGDVLNLSQNCRGAERRRFMDLGILPGTTIRAEMRSPSGDPTAYLVRGALIALRQDQAKLINIVRQQDE